MTARRAARIALPAAVIALVVWTRAAPMRVGALPEADGVRAAATYRGDDGREHVYLDGHDSYHWLRAARNLLRTGSPCDEIRDGACYETLAHAPVGRWMRYARPVHPGAIAAMHRLATFLQPGFPLPSSAFWLGVVIAALGVIPAYALGRFLGGELGGLAAALVLSFNPLFLLRTLDADNDVWNVVLPLFTVWSISAALRAGSGAARAGFAALAAAVTALQAQAWSGWIFTCAVMLAGLASTALILALRAVFQSGAERGAARRGLAGTLLVLGLFAALVAAAAPRQDLAALATGMRDAVRAALPAPAAAPAAAEPFATWPDVLSSVAELSRPSLDAIAHLIGGPLYFFVGWLGLLVLVLPRRDWGRGHFALFIAGTLLYRFLLGGPALAQPHLLALLAIPLAAALLVAVRERDEVSAPDLATGQIAVWWFLAALHLSFGANRFAILLVPPFAIAFAVALGRAQEWLAATIVAEQPARRPLAALSAVALAATLLIPVQRGRAVALATKPRMNDAWWNVLTRLSEQSPPDAIVNTWWDYGYWVKYIAERPVSADGGSVLTHIPHWLARALLAPSEDESAGLLRMLNCASDATPEAEGRAGAWALLLDAGVDPLRAQEVLLELAKLDAAPAADLLAQLGIDATQRAAILAATHCTPPPFYLVISDAMAALRPIRSTGTFDARRAYALHLADTRDRDAAVAALRQRLAVSPEEAEALDRAARAPRSGAERVELVSPAADYFAPGWQSCALVDDEMVCALRVRAGAPRLSEFRYSPSAAAAGRFRLAADKPGAAPLEVTPEALLIRDAAGLREASRATSRDAEAAAAALVDTERRRILVGPPYLIRSTLTRLLYLDEVPGSRFEKVDEETVPGRERVTVWRVR